MMKDKRPTIDELRSQYTGEWNPSEEHWLGLDFSYHGKEYRLQTGPMYESVSTTLENGDEAVFGLYEKLPYPDNGREYRVLEEFSSFDDVLDSKCIGGIVLSSLLLDDETEFVGQD